MEEQTQPVVDQAQEPVADAGPVDPAQFAEEGAADVATEATDVEKKTEEPSEVAPAVSEDRSAFNCAECKGEGLKDEATLCPACQGTGKVV